MFRKMSIALFAVLFAAACGTADEDPVRDDVPEENIAPEMDDELNPRDDDRIDEDVPREEDRIDEEKMPEDQPDVDMEEEPMDEERTDDDG